MSAETSDSELSADELAAHVGGTTGEASTESGEESYSDTVQEIRFESESDEDYRTVLERFAELIQLGKESTSNDDDEHGGETSATGVELDDIVRGIQQGRIQKIVCMCGAGISVSAGIPDFRSPGTGLYSRLEKYNLPHPQAVFEIDFFRSNPDPFYMLSKELFPGTYKPTKTHYFLKLLHDKRLLQRCYTQNIDSLEHLAGLPTEAVIAAHGNFDTAYCIDCRSEHDTDYVREAIMQQTPCRCVKQDGCQGLVKPGIVFFGESLPERFWNSIPSDFAQADLLIVMGSSLVVHPFASLIDRVDQACPRLLINREKVGEAHPELRKMGYRKGFDFTDDARSRDVALLGDCDAMIEKLCDQLGWLDDLNSLLRLG
ncbi:hypothetical protein M9435_000434 [Picochlorum sp. BPE23]|nr:hypothetical protein M9435_000434 [Picochlorum sp. BPE23]